MRISSRALLAIGCCAAPAAVQATADPPPALPSLPEVAAAAEGFAPRGWRVERQARGDLDGDRLADLAFILLPAGAAVHASGEAAGEGPPPPRIFGVALGRRGGGYRLVLGNGRFLPPMRAPNGLSDGYMLFEEGSLEAGDGRLRVLFRYTRSHVTFTFRWRDGALRLIGHDAGGVSGGCLHRLSVNFLTRRAKMSAAWVDRDDELVRWKRLPAGPLPALAELGDGEDYDPFGLRAGFPLRCPERA